MRVEDQFLYPLFFAFSPYTYSSDYACSVTSFGAVVDLEGYDDVYDSYGSAIDVGINGGVGNSYYAVVDDSYGWPLRARIWIHAHGMSHSMDLQTMLMRIMYQFPTVSPVTSIDIHASFVTFNGEVGGRANGDLISRHA